MEHPRPLDVVRVLHGASVAVVVVEEVRRQRAYAEAAVAEALKKVRYRGVLRVAVQDEPLEWLDLSDLKERVGPAQLPLL
jgi:hypothetical protein